MDRHHFSRDGTEMGLGSGLGLGIAGEIALGLQALTHACALRPIPFTVTALAPIPTACLPLATAGGVYAYDGLLHRDSGAAGALGLGRVGVEVRLGVRAGGGDLSRVLSLPLPNPFYAYKG